MYIDSTVSNKRPMYSIHGLSQTQATMLCEMLFNATDHTPLGRYCGHLYLLLSREMEGKDQPIAHKIPADV